MLSTVLCSKNTCSSRFRDDVSEVRRLRDDLVAAGETVWWDDELQVGQLWDEVVDQAIEDAYAFVLCLSEAGCRRSESGVYAEVSKALDIYRRYAPTIGFILPVRMSQCRIPSVRIAPGRYLNESHYVDLWPANYRDSGFQRLLASIRGAPHYP